MTIEPEYLSIQQVADRRLRAIEEALVDACTADRLAALESP